jgi:hypothetical protein
LDFKKLIVASLCSATRQFENFRQHPDLHV